jgi:hypothetical protein
MERNGTQQEWQRIVFGFQNVLHIVQVKVQAALTDITEHTHLKFALLCD